MDRTVHAQHAQVVEKLRSQTAVFGARFRGYMALQLLVDRLDGGDERGGAGREEGIAENGAQKEKKTVLFFVLEVRKRGGERYGASSAEFGAVGQTVADEDAALADLGVEEKRNDLHALDLYVLTVASIDHLETGSYALITKNDDEIRMREREFALWWI